MEKKALIAIALSILVLLVFKYFEDRRMAEQARRRPPVAKPATTTPPAEVRPLPAGPPDAEKPDQTAVLHPQDTVAVEQPIVIDGPLYRAVVDNRGGLLTSWKLKKHKDDQGKDFEMVAASHNSESRPYPGALVLTDPKLNWLANGELYETAVENSEGSGTDLVPPATVRMRLQRGDLVIEKSYQFDRDNYLVDFRVSIQKDSKPVPARVLLGQDIGPEREHLIDPSLQLRTVYNQGGKIKRDGPPEEPDQVRKIEGDVRWVGLDMHYFCIIAITPRPLAAFELQKKPVKTTGLDGKEIARDLLALTIPIEDRLALKMFVGPKEQDRLNAVKDADLSEVIDFGMFSFLVRPLLFSLKWIVRSAHNYGWAIIILTLLLTLLLFPFRLKQMVSMKKMAVVQPKVKEIQEKYRKYKKTDPRRAQMNQEVMALYKEHNVNPLGGCLPLLLQMPLLFAFYQLLASSIELRHAPFMGWIRDLSAKDPYYVLPIVMGITMIISQKMTPMAPGADPMQTRMMMMMPVVFTFMFLNVSSGLNLYFLCSNIFQVGFQKVAERWINDGKPASKG
jgi:YidC/Oxa1 family membrane protein insertase